MIGIYKIVNKITNKIYVGSSSNLYERKVIHFWELSKGKHHSSILQNSYNKHGKHNFNFELLEECEKEKLIEREQYYIDVLRPEYNICLIAGSTKEKLVTISTRKLRAREVQQINPYTNEVVSTFYSIAEAKRQTKINNIAGVVSGVQVSAGGYIWKYKNETEEDRKRIQKKRNLLKSYRKPDYILRNQTIALYENSIN